MDAEEEAMEEFEEFDLEKQKRRFLKPINSRSFQKRSLHVSFG